MLLLYLCYSNMIKLRIAEILKEKGISKVMFADMMGIKKQNVNARLETNNIKKLEEIANVLDVKITDLWFDDTPKKDILNGFVEFNGKVYIIKCIEDITNLITLIHNTLKIEQV